MGIEGLTASLNKYPPQFQGVFEKNLSRYSIYFLSLGYRSDKLIT